MLEEISKPMSYSEGVAWHNIEKKCIDWIKEAVRESDMESLARAMEYYLHSRRLLKTRYWMEGNQYIIAEQDDKVAELTKGLNSLPVGRLK